MGLLVKPRAAEFEQNAQGLQNWLSGGLSSAFGDHISITPANALQLSPILKPVRVRGETFAMLPKKVFERVEIQGKPSRQEAPKHPLYRIVSRNPNPVMTAMQYCELLSADLDLCGDHFDYIERGQNTGRILNLWPIKYSRVRIDDEGSELRYYVQDGKGHEVEFSKDEILHIRGWGGDGVRGYSLIRLSRQYAEWHAKAVRYGSSFLTNASRPSGLVIVRSGFKPEVKQATVDSLKAAKTQVGSLVLVEGDVDYKMMTIPNNEAQFLETVQLQEEDWAGIFRVPQHKVGNLRRSTNNNIEHQDIEFVRDTIQPICERVEQAWDLQLLSDFPGSGRGGGTERERYFTKCNLDGLLRGDTAARTQYYRERFNIASLSPNDIRKKEDEEPIEGGDEYYINLAMVPLSMAKQLLTAQMESKESDGEQDLAAQDRITSELQARVRRSYSRVFRPAVGKALQRAVKDRERAVPGLFDGLLQGLAEGLGRELDDEFVNEYLGAMAKRSLDWTDAEEVTGSELDRAVKAILERGKHAE